MNIALMILGMALINLAIRWPVYLFADHVRFPHIVERALRFVPVAVLTAIIVPQMLYPHGDQMMDFWRNPYLLAGVITAAIARIGNNLLATIGLGMAAFLALRWYLGA